MVGLNSLLINSFQALLSGFTSGEKSVLPEEELAQVVYEYLLYFDKVGRLPKLSKKKCNLSKLLPVS